MFAFNKTNGSLSSHIHLGQNARTARHLRSFPVNRVGHLCHRFPNDNRGDGAEMEISTCIGICASVSGLLGACSENR